MNWNISAWSIRNPVPTIVLFLVLTIAGLASLRGLSIALDPNIDIPTVSVQIAQKGAAPTELETQVTRKVEDAVAGIGNIKHITSRVSEGNSFITIEFVLGTGIDRAVNDVRDAVTKIRSSLPQGIDEPIIQRVDAGEDDDPFISYTVASNRHSVTELSWMVDNEISRSLLSVPGVSRVQRFGGVDREIRINLNPNRLQALGITANQVNAQIRALNIDLPGGRSEVGTTEQAIRTLGSAATIEQLRATQILLFDGRYARLDTLGSIEDASAEQRQHAFLNRRPVVSFSVVRSNGSNLVDVEAGVQKTVTELQKRLPSGVKVEMTSTRGDFVRESYEASIEALWLGAALAVVVIWIFLRDWRSTLIAGLAMPLSIIPTFAVMKVAGFTLNNMTLLALALVVGILVDDAIVEIENIVRHVAMGKTPYQASLDAADEIGLAVVATTMTIVAVFVPVAFMGGVQGQYFRQFGWVVAASVLFSLLVARMVTPLMAAYWLKAQPHLEQKSALVRAYERLLTWALAHRFATLGLAAGFFAMSLALLPMLPTSLVSSSDDGESILSINLPPGASIRENAQALDRLSKILLAQKEVVKVYATGGGSETRRGRIVATLKPRSERKLTKKQFEAKVRPKLNGVPGVRLFFGGAGLSRGKAITIVLSGDDAATLKRVSEELTDQMRNLPTLTDAGSSASLLRPEIHVRPQFERAAEQGVSVEALARTALIASLGDIDANLAKFNLPDRQINIRVQLDPRFREDLSTIENLQVAGAEGRLVPLKSVASVAVNGGDLQIDRYDRARQVSVSTNMAPGTELGQAIAQIHDLPAMRNLPPGIEERPTGDVEVQSEIFSSFGFAIATAVLLIYAVLVLLFGGFLHPFTIMMSLPLSLGGAVLGLMVMGKSLGLYALIGIVMLMGLVTKNAILLVEYCLMAMKEGYSQRDAIMASGEARMRPILMTTIAMIVGMLPIALGVGAGSETRSPMAVAVVGGLMTSTLLTLLVVPVVFAAVDDTRQWALKLITPRREQSGTATSLTSEALPSASQQE